MVFMYFKYGILISCILNMITTVNELLKEIKNKGVVEIKSFLNIENNVYTGRMYEELTKKFVEKSVFSSCDLRVVSGKITNNKKEIFSKQIDCMIVIGEGEKMPFIDEFVYNIDQVIMVIEVKKNLYKKELSDGFSNLYSVIEIQEPTRELSLTPIEIAFKSISKKKLPEFDDIKKLDIRDQMLYHSLVIESLLPLRVIFGYEGLKDEKSLRNKFVEYLKENISEDGNLIKGYGASSLPNLIISGDCALIKTNGMPYTLTFDDVNEYCWIASYRRNPLILFLEILWTRLSFFYNLPISVFGSKTQIEGLVPLLTARGTKEGWVYNEISYSDENIKVLGEDKEWEPSILSKIEFYIMNQLCNEEFISIKQLSEYLQNEEEMLQIIKHLSDERLIYTDGENIKLLTKNCICFIDPSIGYAAADNCDGKVTKWLEKRYYLKETSND